MKTIIFDFNTIEKLPDFYKSFQQKFSLNADIANNLDGLWDTITGYIELPVKIEFTNLTLQKLDKFSNLISLFEEAEIETDNDLMFSYFLSNPSI